jgi:hypothetical protein
MVDMYMVPSSSQNLREETGVIHFVIDNKNGAQHGVSPIAQLVLSSCTKLRGFYEAGFDTKQGTWG